MADAPSDDPDRVSEIVAEACARRGLSGDDVFLVEMLLDQHPMTWPACCHSDCATCMEDVAAAARDCLSRLGRSIG